LRKNNFSQKFWKKKVLSWLRLKENGSNHAKNRLKNVEKMDFFAVSKWPLITICHHSSVPKCPPDFRESFSSHIDTPMNFGEKNFDFKMTYLMLYFAEALQNSFEMAIYDVFSRGTSSNTRCFSASMRLGRWRR